MAPIRKSKEEEGSQTQDRRQRENKRLCCLTLAGRSTGEDAFSGAFGS
jgi:hypothetical protein